MPYFLLLSEMDRSRYDLPAEIEYTPGRYGRKAVAELKRQTGYTLDRIQAGLDGIPKLQPDGTEVVEKDDVAFVAYAWLLAWDAGHKIPWDDFDLRGPIQSRSDEDEVEDEGKVPDPATSSTTTDPA